MNTENFNKILISSYLWTNFSYFAFVWMLYSASSLKKIQNLQKRALRFLCNYCEISYEELLSKSSTSLMNVKRLGVLCIELHKNVNKLNPNFMKYLFKLRLTNNPVREKYRMNLIITGFNQVSYGKKSLIIFSPKIWNSLSYHIKPSENLESFKRKNKQWNWERWVCLKLYLISWCFVLMKIYNFYYYIPFTLTFNMSQACNNFYLFSLG